jgi:two-component system, chemotaxis family, protein-glutamate methylesterase/glutaminase
MSGQNPIRVVVVDDSALMRRMIGGAIEKADDIVVVGRACDAIEGREMIKALDPDVVTLDVAMPGMSGMEFLRKIMELRPMPVIMVSNLTADGAETSVSALQIGAIDVVQKPQGLENMDAFSSLLQAKVRIAASVRESLSRRSAGGTAPLECQDVGRPSYVRSILAIGASTGGVSALSRLLSKLPDRLPPIVIVQHMPKDYPERFAARLRAELRRDISEARDGEILQPGSVRIAPGDRHLRVARKGTALLTVLEEAAPVSGHCPSVDVLFESVARVVGGRAVGVILTGMGRDGALGLATMRRAGGACLGQDKDSSVVYGMPRAALEVGAIDEEVSLDLMPSRICHYLSTPVGDRRTAC